jgi:8-oxo-dGTP pyrophosphatase MutT (NUDIX family)
LQEPELDIADRFRRWVDRLAARAAHIPPMRQAGAIPYAIVEGRVVFLLITTRRTGRWIFPKGAPIEGFAPWQVAAHEALEEAGVEGEVETTPIGIYRTLKAGIRPMPIEVEMYPLRVIRQVDDWPEKGKRHRHWVILPEARRLLSERKLAEFAAELEARLTRDQPATARITA